jgi:hypothetical protein
MTVLLHNIAVFIILHFSLCIFLCNSIRSHSNEIVSQQQLKMLRKHAVKQYIYQHLMASTVLNECLENFVILPHNAKVNNVEKVKRKNAKIFAKIVVQSLHNVHLKIPKVLTSPVLENVHSKMLKKMTLKSPSSLLLEMSKPLPTNFEEPRPPQQYLRSHQKMMKTSQPLLNSGKSFRLKRVGGGTRWNLVNADAKEFIKSSALKPLKEYVGAALPRIIDGDLKAPPALKSIADMANLKGFSNLADVVKQHLSEHSELFDQTFGKIFDPESAMAEKSQGCKDKVMAIDGSSCINSVANRGGA